MNKFRYKLREHVNSSWWVYLFVALCFLGGVVFGSLGVNSLNLEQQTALGDFLNKGLAGYVEELDFSTTTRQALFKNLYNLAKICGLGLTVIGMPLILAIIFTRGFVLGFTVVFLFQEKAWQGGLIAMLAVLPPNLLSLPAYILAAVIAINFSLYLLKGGEQRSLPLPQYFFGYLLASVLLGLLMVGAALIEGYLSPLFIKLLYAGSFAPFA